MGVRYRIRLLSRVGKDGGKSVKNEERVENGEGKSMKPESVAATPRFGGGEIKL
jgi:hypothetical protein